MKRITAALVMMLIISLICIGCSEENASEASSLSGSVVSSEAPSQGPSAASEESEAVLSSDTFTSVEEESSAESRPVSSVAPTSSEMSPSRIESTDPSLPAVSEPPTVSEPPVSSEYNFEGVTYESYLKMSSDEQYAYICTFDSPADFALWYHEAKAEYEKEHPPIEIGPGGNIDLGGIISGTN